MEKPKEEWEVAYERDQRNLDKMMASSGAFSWLESCVLGFLAILVVIVTVIVAAMVIYRAMK